MQNQVVSQFEFQTETLPRITYSGGERVPQHELLACAQCGCFAFSCFEDFAIRVKKLPLRLRRVFLLRHYVGMKIGSDNLAKDEAGELTIAAHFGRTGRTIRNWLKEADRLLTEFQEKHDGK